MNKRFLLVAVALLGSACIHTIEYGHQFDSARIVNLEKGKSTKQEVLTMFGSPNSTSLDGDGIMTMHYIYLRSRGTLKPTAFIPIVGPVVGGSSETNSQKSLVVTLKNDVVTNFIYTQDGPPVDFPAKKKS